MKKFNMLIICGVIITSAILIGKYLIESKPQSKPKEIVKQLPFVDIVEANLVSQRATIEAFGTVQARTLTNLIAEVPGLIEGVAPFENEVNQSIASFQNGGFFEKGDLLVKIVDIDLLAREAETLANLRRTEYQLAQERALADQAKTEWGDRDWKLATALVKRQPQILKAEAEAKAAEALHNQAKKNVLKANVRAPFRGRILNILADVGQQVGSGSSSALAKIYSIKKGEVQLALSRKELSFLNFNEGSPHGENQIAVEIVNEEEKAIHSGVIDRSQGIIDPRTRLHNLVARFENCFTDPFNQISKIGNPLSIGQFVKLKLIGPEIDVFIIPISAFREQNTILVLDQEDRLTVRKVKSVKRDGLEVWVVGGIQEGERVCITPMDIIAEGMKVKISSSTADQNKIQ
ncbi:MAG: efflux RND transporter periplasmic adaptor subunit [Opitutae bacterium]|nr:efflux RND transporter periplasmic adaptor subunit [Opitutae bacterium]